MRSNVTKVTAAYAISRTTPKVAYFCIREDKTFFSFHTDFLLKGQMTYGYTCIVCPDVSSRDSKRAKHVIPIHTNIITLETKRLPYIYMYGIHVYVFGVGNSLKKDKTVPLQAWTGPEGSR